MSRKVKFLRSISLAVLLVCQLIFWLIRSILDPTCLLAALSFAVLCISVLLYRDKEAATEATDSKVDCGALI